MLKASVQVKGADRAKRSIGELINKLDGNNQVLIGVQKGTLSQSDENKKPIPLAVIAAANHFGTKDIPARPYLDVALTENSANYSKTFKELLPDVLDGKKSTGDLLRSLGNQAASDVRVYMDELASPPNAPATVRRKKGEDNPLIDTGHMKQSIQFEIAREPVEEGL